MSTRLHLEEDITPSFICDCTESVVIEAAKFSDIHTTAERRAQWNEIWQANVVCSIGGEKYETDEKKRNIRKGGYFSYVSYFSLLAGEESSAIKYLVLFVRGRAVGTWYSDIEQPQID
jgi:hypothetical protein